MRYLSIKGAAVAIAALAPSAFGLAVSSGQAAEGPTTTLALEFNELFGSTTAADSSGMGHDGVIGSHVRMKAELDPFSPDGSGFTNLADFDRHPPNEGIDYGLDHLIVVPDAEDGSIDPGTGDFTIEMRFRTKDKFGNVLQKGQARSSGGQVKIQAPGGRIQCLFKGSQGKAAAGTGTAKGVNTARFHDNVWHTLRCERTPESVTLYIDDVQYGKTRHATGNIDNKKPWTFGGKPECDAVVVTCDYFPGDIDYVRMTKG